MALNYQPPMGRVFAQPPLRSMPFKFSGTGWKLLRMGIFRRQPSLDFSLSSAPVQVISRTDISLKIEDELQLNLLELGQDNVTLRLDSLFSKKVKIKLDSIINFQNGYFFRDAFTLTPDSIVVFGASQMLDGISEVSTEPLKMACPETDFRKTLKLINPNPALLQFSSLQTELFLPVEQFTEKKLMLPVMVLNEQDSIQLVPATVELSCVVGVSRFNQVSASDFRVVAVFGGESGPGGVASTVPLTLVRQPEWVRSVQLSPKVVEYLIVE
ncbi:MAG: hypothetical protein IPM82_18880 [Saprospiraceae bacterium]|nr:hypothetical protein [Saprospiraceae bacterium]